MNWIELSASVPAEQVEELCSALAEIAPGGCSVEDPVVPLGPEEGVRREPWRPSIVRFYLPVDTHLAERRAAAQSAAGAFPFAVRLAERSVREEDWANAWKEFFQVERIGARLVIQPTWREFEAGPNDVVLNLDPGMAFGTGQHETTRMCLEAVEALVHSGMALLDVGTGSGILAVAAARLGAERVDALDIDSVAIEATTANASRNGVGERIRAAEGSLDERWPFGRLPESQYDLALANIHAAAVTTLAPALAKALRPGGGVIVSGIIASRLSDVLEALAAAHFEESDVRAAGEWRCIVARTRGEAAMSERQ